MKEYVCPRYPGYSIGRDIQFVSGRFSTEDLGLIRQVESNDWYKVFIWPTNGKDYNDDKASEGRVPPIQCVETGASAGAGAEECGGSEEQGREESPVLQELEELVRGSGIISGKGRKNKSRLG